MQLTFRADYALRALLYLATHRGRLVSTAEISHAFGVSNNHLVKVMLLLTRKGYIRSYRGRSGGNELAREPELIKLGEVVRDIEPDFRIVECFDIETNTCPILPVCGLKPILGKAGNAFLQVLDQYTLAHLAPAEMLPALNAHYKQVI